ncbi:nuclear pore complex protein nup107 [Anopheles darlingi]|uniref:Nuclear pore complex protein n=1 Tax=Anopheles darlingi TaxID=43151 RepID=W5JL65_ANODA|nr:nuclear pore complex protein nup107 [Anopheles darlingi]
MMDQLERSLQLLDESTVKSKRGLLRSKDVLRPLQHQQQQYERLSRSVLNDSSLGIPLDSVQDISAFRSFDDASSISTSVLSLAAGSTAGNAKEITKRLCVQFLEVVNQHDHEANVFDTLEELVETLELTLTEMDTNARQLQSVGRERRLQAEEMWLHAERETWKLMCCLYRDRTETQRQDSEMDDLPLVNSERTIIEHLYEANANLREYQLIVDWLEQMAQRENKLQAGCYTNRTVAWENTLHQLLEIGQTAFGSGRPIVKSLDPDAPIREKRPLHDLDAEDQARLSRDIFLELRQGRLDVAQSKCEHCGQAWKAAILEGWKLHHDPNYGSETATTLTRTAIEGNPRRDLWKKFAWKMAESRLLDPYTKASIGSLCGHLEAMLELLSEHTWTDMLWGYLKVQIDIRVESEIRSHCIKSYLPMPDRYWSWKMSLEQIFDELEAHRNARISLTAKDVDKVIQKYLILDDIPQLMRIVDGWIGGTADVVLSPPMLRFLAHFVIFTRQIGKPFQEEIGDRVIKRYVEYLISLGDPALVAFYTSSLPSDMQLLLYSNFLETITEKIDRKRALEEANGFGLDVPTITVYTVEKYRALEPEDAPEPMAAAGELSALDNQKISSLEWLTFYPAQRGELLWQANALIRYFLAKRSIEAARKTFAVVPSDTMEQIYTHYGSKDDIPWREEVSIREYLCHQSYLAALDSYNDWTVLFYNNRPKPPPAMKVSNFTERVTSEHREQAYRNELSIWEHRLGEATNRTHDLLYNILMFPEDGWLVDADPKPDVSFEQEEDWQHRVVQMESLRKLCIPEVVLLLHQLHTLTERHSDNLVLADVLCSESRKLYSVFAKHKLAETLTKIAESSLALMNTRSDPFVGDAVKK